MPLFKLLHQLFDEILQSLAGDNTKRVKTSTKDDQKNSNTT